MNASPPTANTSGSITDQPLATAAVIPEPTRRRKLNLQTAARLYIYGGETNLAEIARQVGCSHRNLCQVRQDDGWDDFAARIWAEQHGATGLSVRTPAQDALIIQQMDRQQKQIPKLSTEIDRILEAMIAEPPGSKLHTAMIASLGKLEALVEKASGMDIAKQEIVARIKAATLNRGIAPPTEPSTAVNGRTVPAGSDGRIVDVEHIEEAGSEAEAVDTRSQSTAQTSSESERGESESDGARAPGSEQGDASQPGTADG